MGKGTQHAPLLACLYASLWVGCTYDYGHFDASGSKSPTAGVSHSGPGVAGETGAEAGAGARPSDPTSGSTGTSGGSAGGGGDREADVSEGGRTEPANQAGGSDQGEPPQGGAGSGGISDTGGVQSTGGLEPSGGAESTGGWVSTGGVTGTGGIQSTGGGEGGDGGSGTGGAAGTGGAMVCESPLVTCGSQCADLNTNSQHCGSCHNACSALADRFVCVSGECGCDAAKDCGPQFTLCENHRCVCSGTTCAPGEACQRRGDYAECICAHGPACTGGNACCPAGCRDLNSDRDNCGRCGNACAGDEACTDGVCG